MNKFLDDDDLIKLTGFKMKSLQINHLKEQAIPFKVNRTGHPVVLWSDLERKPKHKEFGTWNPRVLA